MQTSEALQHGQNDHRTKYDVFENHVPDRIFRRGDLGAMIGPWLVATREAELETAVVQEGERPCKVADEDAAFAISKAVGRLVTADNLGGCQGSKARTCSSLAVAVQVACTVVNPLPRCSSGLFEWSEDCYQRLD